MRAEIRVRFGFREVTVVDADMLTVWLCDHVAGEAGGEIEPMITRLEAWCRELAIEPPTADRVERIVLTALRSHEDRFHANVYERLSPTTRARLDALLRPEDAGSDDATLDDAAGSAPAVLLTLRGSPGRPSLASMQDEFTKLNLIREIDLPDNLFDRALPRNLERCRQRVSVGLSTHSSPEIISGRLQLEFGICISVSKNTLYTLYPAGETGWRGAIPATSSSGKTLQVQCRKPQTRLYSQPC